MTLLKNDDHLLARLWLYASRADFRFSFGGGPNMLERIGDLRRAPPTGVETLADGFERRALNELLLSLLTEWRGEPPPLSTSELRRIGELESFTEWRGELP